MVLSCLFKGYVLTRLTILWLSMEASLHIRIGNLCLELIVFRQQLLDLPLHLREVWVLHQNVPLLLPTRGKALIIVLVCPSGGFRPRGNCRGGYNGNVKVLDEEAGDVFLL